MRIWFSVKKISAILLLSLLITGAAVPGVSSARVEARYELISGDAIFGNDFGATTCKQTLFHQQTLDTSDLESISINFPPSADGTDIGPLQAMGSTAIGGITASGSATANVIPFGPVDLAFPDISETVSQSYSASSTGFYTASFLSIPPINPGSSPVTAGVLNSGSTMSAPTSLVGSSMMFPEMNNIIPGYDETKATSQSANQQSPNTSTNQSSSTGNTTNNNTTDISAPGIFNETAAGEGIVGNGLISNDTIFNAQLGGQSGQNGSQYQTISGQEKTGAETSVPLNYTGQTVTNQNLSYPYFQFNSGAGAISNTSLLDRMWRNAHLGTMGRAYEGDTSSPDWILPTEYTDSAIAMRNWAQVNSIALNQTEPGTQLTPRFWDLGITSFNSLPDNFVIGPQTGSNANTNVNSSTTGNQTSGSGSGSSSSGNIISNVPSIGNITAAFPAG